MRGAKGNPAVTRIQSWAEEVREEEADRALRQLQTVSAKDKKTLNSLSKRLVDEILISPSVFAEESSHAFPNSRRLPIVCRMFERQGVSCDASHCVACDAFKVGVPLEESCGMIMSNEKNRGAWR